MFKRPRLSVANRLVNVSPALALLFMAASCSPSNESNNGVQRDTAAGTLNEEGARLSIPSVWSTSDLGGALQSVAIAGGDASRVAVSYSDGGVQLLSFDAERLTEKAMLDAVHLADGRRATLSGTDVTFFPGTTRSGNLALFIHGGALPAPVAYGVEVEGDGAVAGLCSGLPLAEGDGLLRLAYWTSDTPQTLRSGRLVEVADEIIFLPNETVDAARPITACLLGDSEATVLSAPVIAAVNITQPQGAARLILDSSGNYTATTNDLNAAPLTVTDGITVRVPQVPVDMAGTGDARDGGYGNGVVLIAGRSENGDVVVFADPGTLLSTRNDDAS